MIFKSIDSFIWQIKLFPFLYLITLRNLFTFVPCIFIDSLFDATVLCWIICDSVLSLICFLIKTLNKRKEENSFRNVWYFTVVDLNDDLYLILFQFLMNSDVKWNECCKKKLIVHIFRQAIKTLVTCFKNNLFVPILFFLLIATIKNYT